MKARSVLALWSALAWTGAQLLGGVHAECIDYAGYRDWVGSVATRYPAMGVALSNGYVYVASSHAGMQIVDVGDPAAPKIIGSVDTPDAAYGVAATATHAYVADYLSGVQIIDVRDPDSPRIVAALDTPGAALGVAVADDRCYIADGSGLRIVDVADPATPQLLGSIDTPGSAVDVAISGTLALIADYGGGLRIVDVSNPQSPATVGIVDTPGTAFGVTVSGHYAYVADGQGGLQVIDIAVPQLPQIVGNVSTPRAKDVVVFGQHAYVAANEAGRSGLFVVDVSDPAMPWIVASVETEHAVGVAVEPPYAYVADWSRGLQVIDVGSLARPPMLGSVATPGVPYGVATSKTHAYVADFSSVQVVDITDPSDPEIVGSVGGWYAYAYLAVLSEPYLYAISDAGAYARAFLVINVADPSNPEILGTEYMGFVRDIAVSRPFAYVVDAGTWAPHGGLPPRFTVLDITNPQDPVPTGFIDLPDYPFGIVLSVDHAFVAASSSGLLVFDIGTPVPQQVGSLAMENAWAVALSNGYAYVVDSSEAVSNLRVVDVSSPNAPQLVASVAVPGYAGHVVVSGETAYVSTPCSVAIVDVSNPAVPHIIGTVDTPGNAAQIALAGDVMCVASGQVVGGVNGLQLFPVQCGSASGVASSPDRRTGSISIFPNPGLGACTIRFNAPPVGRVRASIHDAAGRLVRLLHDGAAQAGTHDLRWDRLDESGRPVASGVYWARVTTARGAQAEPFVVLR